MHLVMPQGYSQKYFWLKMSTEKQKPENVPNIYLCLSCHGAISSATVFHKLLDLFFLDKEVNLISTFKSHQEMVCFGCS